MWEFEYSQEKEDKRWLERGTFFDFMFLSYVSIKKNIALVFILDID